MCPFVSIAFVLYLYMPYRASESMVIALFTCPVVILTDKVGSSLCQVKHYYKLTNMKGAYCIIDFFIIV